MDIIRDYKSIRCFITGTTTCTKDIKEKDDQLFLAYDYKNNEVEGIIDKEIIPLIRKYGLNPIKAKDKKVNFDFMCKICELIQESLNIY